MPVIKDIVQEYFLTLGVPTQFGGATTPTFNKYKGNSLPERLGGGSDHPSEEPVQQEILDGRQVQASVETSFTQLIMELSESDTLINDLKTAADENTNLWILRDGLASNADAEIIGGQMGLTVSVGKVRQGSEGHRVAQCLFEGQGPGAESIIQPYTGSS